MSDFIDCDPIGECLAVDEDGSRFYSGVRVNGIDIHRFDCVRVILEEEDIYGELFSYGQVLAIYDDGFGDGMVAEIRWLLKPKEVPAVRKKKVQVLDGELVESCHTDDIPAGSIIEKIQVLSPSQAEERKAADGAASSALWRRRDNVFVCRYSEGDASAAVLIPVDEAGRNGRGADLSEFKELYKDEELGLGASFIQSSLEAEEGTLEVSGNSGRFRTYAAAIRRLHISVIPGTLPCRTAEKDKIMNYLRDGIGRGGHIRPLYISGMPGSGKTACFLAALKTLEDEYSAMHGSLRKQARDQIAGSPSGKKPRTGDEDIAHAAVTTTGTTTAPLRPFQFVEVNCLKLHSPQDAYSVLWKGISGDRVSSVSALQKLNDYFTIANNRKLYGNGDVVTVCLLDELDFLVTGNESVVYNFFDWPQQPNSSLIVVGIANTMDLPERLTYKARSRMGGDQTNRMIFQPYTFEQVNEILMARLEDLGVFQKLELEMLSRKAVNAAGDLRAALKICQRAIELHVENIIKKEKTAIASGDVAAPPSNVVTPVPVPLVIRAVAEYKEDPLMLRTANCCLLEKAILVAMCKHAKITDTGNMNIEDMWNRLCDLLNADDRAVRTACGDTLSRISTLSAPGSSIASRLDAGSAEVVLDVPPYHIFEAAVGRLCAQGMLVLTEPKLNSRMGFTSRLLHECLFSTRLMPSDIVAALNKHRYLNYL